MNFSHLQKDTCTKLNHKPECRFFWCRGNCSPVVLIRLFPAKLVYMKYLPQNKARDGRIIFLKNNLGICLSLGTCTSHFKFCSNFSVLQNECCSRIKNSAIGNINHAVYSLLLLKILFKIITGIYCSGTDW